MVGVLQNFMLNAESLLIASDGSISHGLLGGAYFTHLLLNRC
jgi:hypothetical protein